MQTFNCNQCGGHNIETFCFNLQGISAAAQPHLDFLQGQVHRKHPGVSNLKTLHLPEELQTHACSIIRSK